MALQLTMMQLTSLSRLLSSAPSTILELLLAAAAAFDCALAHIALLADAAALQEVGRRDWEMRLGMVGMPVSVLRRERKKG